MKREEKLTLDEFVTAPRKRALPKQVDTEDMSLSAEAAAAVPVASKQVTGIEEREDDEAVRRLDARKALRRVKRERVRGVQNFVNVHLDRETKKRLKLASFTSERSMQSIMERAIIKYLDDNGH